MRFRFTIRDLLWLTLVVALVVVLFIDKKKINSLQNDLWLSEHRIQTTDIKLDSVQLADPNVTLVAPPPPPQK